MTLEVFDALGRRVATMVDAHEPACIPESVGQSNKCNFESYI